MCGKSLYCVFPLTKWILKHAEKMIRDDETAVTDTTNEYGTECCFELSFHCGLLGTMLSNFAGETWKVVKRLAKDSEFRNEKWRWVTTASDSCPNDWSHVSFFGVFLMAIEIAAFGILALLNMVFPLKPMSKEVDWNLVCVHNTYIEALFIGGLIGMSVFLFPHWVGGWNLTFFVAMLFFIKATEIWSISVGAYPIPFSFAAVSIPAIANMMFCCTFYCALCCQASRGGYLDIRRSWAMGAMFVILVALGAAFLFGIWLLSGHGAGRAMSINITLIGAKFFTKVFVLTPIAKHILPVRFMVAVFALDILVAAVGAVTMPYVTNWRAFLMVVFLQEFVMFFRIYAGPDRYNTLFFQGYILGRLNKNNKAVLLENYGSRFPFCQLLFFGASVEEACRSSLLAQGKDNEEFKGCEWIDRALYHVVDVVIGLALSIIVRVICILLIVIARNTSFQKHLYPRFYIEGEEWTTSLFYSCGVVAVQLLTLVIISHNDRLPRPFRIQYLQDEGISMVLIYSSIFKESKNFFYFVCCLAVAGSCMIGTMLKPFGFDYFIGQSN